MEQKMEQYQNALSDMSNEAVEYVRGVPVVKTFGQTIFSFKRFKNAIDNYETWVIAYTKGLRLPMFLTGVSAAAVNLAILHRRTAFRLKPFRRFGVPLLCGTAVYLWTRFFAQTFVCRFDNPVTALAAALVSAIILYLLVLRLLGIRLGRYLAHRVENPAVLPVFLW